MSRCGIALEMNQLANCQMIRKVLQCCSCSGPVVLLAHIFVIEISEEFLSITSSCAKTTKPGTQSRKNYLKKKKVKHPKNFMWSEVYLLPIAGISADVTCRQSVTTHSS